LSFSGFLVIYFRFLGSFPPFRLLCLEDRFYFKGFFLKGFAMESVTLKTPETRKAFFGSAPEAQMSLNAAPKGFRGSRSTVPKAISKRGALRSFTLVEILITVCVLTFGCLAVILMQQASLRGANYSDNLTGAVFLAESELERLKALSFTSLETEVEAGDKTVSNLNRMGKVCNTIPNCGLFPFTRTVKFYPDTPTSFSHQVEIEVTWRDNSGPHRVFYSSALTSYMFT
jgi:Tfp pilus assembly protein PilV